MNIEDKKLKKYRKKPVIIEAFRFGFEDEPYWFIEYCEDNDVFIRRGSWGGFCYINTIEGKMKAEIGDYVIKGVKGELYPCKPDIFELTYEEVECDEH